MNANETLAKYYDPTRRQLIGVDGEFWRHVPGGNWEWSCRFEPLTVAQFDMPDLFPRDALIGLKVRLRGFNGLCVCE
jgi:hypothetical protein